MEKTQSIIKRVKYILTGMIVMGMLFKLQHRAGASQLLIIGFCSLSFLFALQYSLSPKKDIINLLWYLGISVLLMGLLFKMQHWNGGIQMQWVGLAGTVTGGVIKYVRGEPVI